MRIRARLGHRNRAGARRGGVDAQRHELRQPVPTGAGGGRPRAGGTGGRLNLRRRLRPDGGRARVEDLRHPSRRRDRRVGPDREETDEGRVGRRRRHGRCHHRGAWSAGGCAARAVDRIGHVHAPEPGDPASGGLARAEVPGVARRLRAGGDAVVHRLAGSGHDVRPSDQRPAGRRRDGVSVEGHLGEQDVVRDGARRSGDRQRVGSAAVVRGRRGSIGDGRVDHVGQGKRAIVDLECEPPRAVAVLELPLEVGRADVLSVAVEDRGRGHVEACDGVPGRDENAPIRPQARLEGSGLESPAPRLQALPLRDGQELLRPRWGDGDGLTAVRHLAGDAVCKALQRRRTTLVAVEPDLELAGAEAVPALLETDGRACSRRADERCIGRPLAESALQEGGLLGGLVEGGGGEEHDRRGERGSECEHDEAQPCPGRGGGNVEPQSGDVSHVASVSQARRNRLLQRGIGCVTVLP